MAALPTTGYLSATPSSSVIVAPPRSLSASVGQAAFNDDAWERELQEVSDLVEVDIRLAEEREAAHTRSSKRTKLSKRQPDEPSDDLNPRSASKDRTSGMFTMAKIRQFMAEHHAEWKQQQVSDYTPAPRLWAPGKSAVLACSTLVTQTAAACDSAAKSAQSGTLMLGRSPSIASDADPSSSLVLQPLSTGPRGAGTAAATGMIGRLAAAGRWDAVCIRLLEREASAFVSGGPGVGKSTLLKRLHASCKLRFSGEGEVVVLAPTGTSAKTAGGMTYHSFFGLGREYKPVAANASDEARRLLSTSRFLPIKGRLERVRVVLLYEISLVSAANFDVMYHLVLEARRYSSAPAVWFAFGDFLQLRPVSGSFAFTSKTWHSLFGNSLLELTTTYRQRDPNYVLVIQDARLGKCSAAVRQLVKYCGVDDATYH